MQSATSYFNASLFRKNLLRFWPLWALHAAICFFFAPLPLLLGIVHDSSFDSEPIWVARDVVEMGFTGGLFLAAFFGIFFAMAMFSYLTNSRATQGFHALPIRREALFITQYLSGLFAMAASLCAAALLSALILLLGGAFHLKALLLALGTALLLTVFFYSFGVFCMVFTGQILAAPVFYGILNFLAIGIEMLLRSFAGLFLFGYHASYDEFVSAPLSPFYHVIASCRPRYIYADIPHPTDAGKFDRIPVDVTVEGFSLLVLYAAVGLLLTAAALWLYRRRHSEETSTVVAVAWARPIFKYGVAFCLAFSLGQLLYFIVFEGFLYRPPSIGGAVVCMLLAGLVGYFAAEMLLKKRFRVWRGAKGGALVVAVVLVVFGFGMSMDITGYEGYLPEVEEVESVTVNLWASNTDVYGDFYDPAAIAALQEVQRALIADKDRWIASNYNSSPVDYDEGHSSLSLRLTYYLTDGSAVHRRYYANYLLESELTDPTSLAARTTDFINCGEVAYARVFGSTDYDLDAVTYTGGYVDIWNRDTKHNYNRDLDAAEAETLYTALKADFLAGHANNASIFDTDAYIGTMAEKFADPNEGGNLSISAELWFNYRPDALLHGGNSSHPVPEVAVSAGSMMYPKPSDLPDMDNGGIHITVSPNLTFARAALAEICGEEVLYP